MKKVIIIEILLTIVFVVLLVCAIIAFRYIAAMKEYIELSTTLDPDYPNYSLVQISANDNEFFCKILLGLAIPMIIAAPFVLAVMVIIAVKDFPFVKQRISEFKAKRAEAKAEKAEADKQARIEALQAELDELKKDE